MVNREVHLEPGSLKSSRWNCGSSYQEVLLGERRLLILQFLNHNFLTAGMVLVTSREEK